MLTWSVLPGYAPPPAPGMLGPAGLAGFGAQSDLPALHAALVNASQKLGIPAANPGTYLPGFPVSFVTEATVAALVSLIAAAPIPKIPASIKALLQIGGGPGAYVALKQSPALLQSATPAIESAAPVLTQAINAYVLLKTAGGNVPGMVPGMVQAGGGAVPFRPLPPGSITAFSPSRRRYRVAIPVGTTVAGFGEFGACVACRTMGEDATHQELPDQPVKPSGATEVTEEEFDRKTGQSKPFFKKPLFWAAVGGGAVVLVGGWLLLR